ncbi:MULTISPECIES: hypothetical protein [Cylindrospermopsis]|jgi:hypothetical protein|uniref:Uncharacterized protein n=1 Tax=Cylindrospermopsis curvispora GIHE-G1 TaxID=2666332 RepID=A0A7H0EZK2_9CYAN|nr:MULTISPECIES: hypothetical protein [Cylindrospermopsis]KRH97663.1 hypothetical protein ASL19_14930 [Cylindrospermopsis sp. CR12]MBU6346652.1 hypothetical protein [Cyanobacteria bacterium REEB494]QNP29218.1 hypothetical protein IAR63_15480 [Cylindrospermopsis curvispora GIHE-G1]UJS05365.1 hypothetical protein L3I90_03715 [Cylindrospermopsis raciborskii KLL07]
MSFENVSLEMQRRFEVLDEMIEKGYIEPIKPLVDWLPTLCYSPARTSTFDNAPENLKRKFTFMFSWYAFLFAIFAFVQTRLARDYLICISTINLITLIYPFSELYLYSSALVINIFAAQCFVFSRYYQYKTFGRCPHSRNAFSTICLSLIYLFGLIIIDVIIQP